MISETIGSASKSSSGPRPSASSASSLRSRPRSSPLGSSRACSSRSSSMSCRTRGASALSCSSSGRKRRQVERLEQEAAQPALQAIALGVGQIGHRGDRVLLHADAPSCAAAAAAAAPATSTACSATTLGSAAEAPRARRGGGRRRPVAAAAAAAGHLAGGGARGHRAASRAGQAEAQEERPDLDRLAERQRLRARDALALDEGAVGRQVAHHQPGGGDLDRSVLARDVVVLEHHGRVRAAPDDDERARQRRDRARSLGRCDFDVHCRHSRPLAPLSTPPFRRSRRSA